MRSLRIIGLGELLWDLLPGGKVLGGAPANFACHAKGLGANASIISAVGDDSLGREIISEVKARGFDENTIEVNSYPTGTVSVEMSADGQPSYTIHEDVAWDHLGVTNAAREVVEGADAICFGSLAQRSGESRSTVLEMVRSAPSVALKVFDVNLRQHYYTDEVLRHSLELSNALKLNEEELAIVGSLVTSESDERPVMEKLAQSFDLRLVALTRGARGSLLLAGDAWSERSGIPVDVKDTVGAGDAFLAGLVVGTLNGLALDTINRCSGELAAYVCRHRGATPTIPDFLREPFAAPVS